MPQTDCALCQAHLEGDAYLWQDYAKSPSLTALVGSQCQHCGSVFCNNKHGDQLKFSVWSGWQKTICPKCGQPFGPSKALVRQGTVIKNARPVPLVDAPAAPVAAGEGESAPSAAVAEEGACPTCGGPRPATGSYCAACGYDFDTKQPAVGPATFDFPEVKSAYTPSGKITPLGLILMAVFALVVGWIGGAFVEIGDIVISGLGSLFISSGGIIALAVMILALLGYAGVGGLIGMAIGRMVFRGAALGRSRNPWVAGGFGLVGGAVAFLAFMVLRTMAHGAEATDSAIDMIKLALYLGGLLIGAGYLAYESVRANPFCEDCNSFMKKTSLKPIPAFDEARLMDWLQARSFAAIAGVQGQDVRDAGNVLNVSVWACAKCADRGFVHVEKVQTRTIRDGGTAKQQVLKRLIYSAPLASADLDGLGVKAAGK